MCLELCLRTIPTCVQTWSLGKEPRNQNYVALNKVSVCGLQLSALVPGNDGGPNDMGHVPGCMSVAADVLNRLETWSSPRNRGLF